VRLQEAVPELELSGYDLSWVAERGGTRRWDRKSEWRFVCSGGSIQAQRAELAEAAESSSTRKGADGSVLSASKKHAQKRRSRGRASELSFKASRESFELGTRVELESPTGVLSVAGKPYREKLLIRALVAGCEVVNTLDFEDYLEGVVNSEVSASWNPGVVGAQAVAARTYAYAKLIEPRGELAARRSYDVDASVKDQVYGGFAREDFRASRLVEQTRGLVLLAPDGSPLRAFYHSTCGGVTELPERVWGSGAPGFRHRVPCGECQESPAFRWKLELSGDELREALSRGGRDGRSSSQEAASGASLQDVAVESAKGDSGRVDLVLLRWRQGKRSWTQRVGAAAFRSWVGPSRLRSTVFRVERPRRPGLLGWVGSGASEPGVRRWLFVGRGNGHGVGMCQWGAKALGDRGLDYSAILKRYYPEARIAKLW
jgi:stage II sporulation protein D